MPNAPLPPRTIPGTIPPPDGIFGAPEPEPPDEAADAARGDKAPSLDPFPDHAVVNGVRLADLPAAERADLRAWLAQPESEREPRNFPGPPQEAA